MRSPTIPTAAATARSTATNSCGARALCGDADGWRLGLGVLQHRGVAAWLGVRSAMAPVRSTPTRALPPATGGGVGAELVGLLASMALAVAARG